MDTVYQSGNTVRLECTFEDFNGYKVDPDTIKVIFYDYRYTKINEIIIGLSNKKSTGVYYYDYVTPVNEENKRVYYEWYGEIDGTPALKRGSFIVRFV